MKTKTFYALFLTAPGLVFAAPESGFAADGDSQWDKVFAQSDKVTSKKVTFKNRFGIMLTGDNKELMIIPNANHVDLYYKPEVIPFDKIENFFKTNLQSQ